MFAGSLWHISRKSISLVLILGLMISPEFSYAQSVFVSTLPEPGKMVNLSSAFTPILVKGLVVHPDKPLNFDFIVDSGNDSASHAVVKEQSEKIVKYFLAALTVPEQSLWVNLSPYEKDRIIDEGLGQTLLGRDMLAQDYVLKQLTASLVYPEEGLGKEFWTKIYKEAQAKFGTADIPVDTFNKVWIMPDKAEVFEKDASVYVTQAHLKVMLDSDYAAQQKNVVGADLASVPLGMSARDEVSRDLIRQIILPAIEKEVNEGKNFATLRQVYYAAILAKWYRELVQDTLMAKGYVGANKINGVTSDEKTLKEEIYQRYIAAYKQGVFNYIKEEANAVTGEATPKKYFSGGISDFAMKDVPLIKADNVNVIRNTGKIFEVDFAMDTPRDVSTIKKIAGTLGLNWLAYRALKGGNIKFRMNAVRYFSIRHDARAIAALTALLRNADANSEFKYFVAWAAVLLGWQPQAVEERSLLIQSINVYSDGFFNTNSPSLHFLLERMASAEKEGKFLLYNVASDLLHKLGYSEGKYFYKSVLVKAAEYSATKLIPADLSDVNDGDTWEGGDLISPAVYEWQKILRSDAAMVGIQDASFALAANVDLAMINEVLQWVQSNGWTIAGVVSSTAAAVGMVRNWWLKNTLAGNIYRFERGGYLVGDRLEAFLAHRDHRAIPELVIAWQKADSSLKNSFARTLYRLGWTPETMDKKIEFYAEASQWDELIKIGRLAVPMLRVFERWNELVGMGPSVMPILLDVLVSAESTGLFSKYNAVSDALHRIGHQGGNYVYVYHPEITEIHTRIEQNLNYGYDDWGASGGTIGQEPFDEYREVHEIAAAYWEKVLRSDAAMTDIQGTSSALAANVDPAMINEVLQWVQSNPWTTAGVVSSLSVSALMARNWWLRNTVAGNIKRAEVGNEDAKVWLIKSASLKARSFVDAHIAEKWLSLKVVRAIALSLRSDLERARRTAISWVLSDLCGVEEGLDLLSRLGADPSLLEKFSRYVEARRSIEARIPGDAVSLITNDHIYFVAQLKQRGEDFEVDYDPAYEGSDGIMAADGILWGEETPPTDASLGISARSSNKNGKDPAQNGGIDIKNINVMRKDGSTKILFNDAEIKAAFDGGFDGFTPVFIKMTPIESPLVVLGVN